MQNKKLLLVVSICAIFVVAFSVTAYFLINKNEEITDSASRLKPANSDSANESGLKVDDSLQSGSQLGSGQNQQSQQNKSEQTNKNSFNDYEQYANATTIYFGDIKEGTGAEAGSGKNVAVTYIGYLTTGQIFDQSRVMDNNGTLQPLEFTIGAGQLIPGFEQGVNGMKEGGVRRVIIPPSLGYGNQAQGPIPANSVLIFDITLVKVQ